MEGRHVRGIEEQVRDAVRTGVPDLRVGSVAHIGEGVDNLAYEVNGELVVRFSKEPDPVRRAELISAEAELLAAIAKISTLPVPEPVFTDPERGCWAYPKLPGVPLLDLPPAQRLVHGPAVAAALGSLLAALHAVPIEEMARFVGPDEVPPAEWRDEAAENYAAVFSEIPAVRRTHVEAFLAAPPPPGAGALVFSHNDLGIEHVLVAPATGAITGVIDWSDAALVDPAYDFGLIHRDLGPAALAAALSGYPVGDPAALRERAVFYARCTLLEDFGYGLQTGLTAYTAKSLMALEWLFSA
ncbi:phosphotransferase family protein [Actinomadura alba]|uniref:Aminoglycoside phosphotransferase family protein n=1 Tax=Actinomadura alba TaxID=406431 RepID=A0ABR7LNZ3_9ACTN|nr:phosphotransferase [Actinomadura alba]MBC6466455.1 aminoglycoside phosphotransferase family protein [Actinomadura alba]